MRKLRIDELGRVSVEEFKILSKIPIAIVLDNVRSAYNVGSVFRTADAFRIEKIYLCGITATPPHREIEKTALGSTNSVKWIYFKNTTEAIESLIQESFLPIAIEQVEGSIKLMDYIPSVDNKYALVFGNEVSGITDEVLNMCVNALEIPQFGTKHSLNISVTVGILLWHFYFHIRDKMMI